MRKFFNSTLAAAFITLLIPFTSFAHDSASVLHQSMKELGKISKQLNVSITDGSQNAANIEKVNRMIELFKASYDHANEAVEDMPTSQQAAALAEIQNMIKQEADLAAQLIEALKANDNASAKMIWTKMTDLKEDGHDKYK